MKADCRPTGAIGGSDRSSTWPVNRREMPLAKNSVRSVAGSSARGPVWPNGLIRAMAARGVALAKRGGVPAGGVQRGGRSLGNDQVGRFDRSLIGPGVQPGG